MKHLNNLLFASFGLLAILQQVQTNPRMCRYGQKVKDVDYCEDFGENHLGCNNKGKWKKSCGTIEPKISMSKNLKKMVVKTHNVYRNTIAKGKLSNVPMAARMFKLHWDKNLATIADYILKQCSLDHPGRDFGAPNAKDPGFNAAYSMFPIDEDQDSTKILMSHLKKWYDQYQYITYRELSTDHSPPGKETSHFKQLAIGINSRIGCAMGRYSKNNWMYQMTICVYGCKKQGGQKPFLVGKRPGEDCVCGVGTEFRYLCHEYEYEKDCGDCIEPDRPKRTTVASEEDINIPSRPCTLTGKFLKWLLCLKGIIKCNKRKGCSGL